MELQLILLVALGGVVLVPKLPAPREQSSRGLDWPEFPSRARLEPNWPPLLD